MIQFNMPWKFGFPLNKWIKFIETNIHTLSIATSVTDSVSATLEKSFLSKKIWNTKNFMNFSLFTCAPAVVLTHNTNVCLFWYIKHEHSNSSLFSFHHLKIYLTWCIDIFIHSSFLILCFCFQKWGVTTSMYCLNTTIV